MQYNKLQQREHASEEDDDDNTENQELATIINVSTLSNFLKASTLKQMVSLNVSHTLTYYPRHNGLPNGCSFFSLKGTTGTTIGPTIVHITVT